MVTLLLLVRATYMYGVVLYAHPVHGESHNQRNTTREVATVVKLQKSLSCINRVKEISIKSDAVIKRATSGSRALGSRPLILSISC